MCTVSHTFQHKRPASALMNVDAVIVTKALSKSLCKSSNIQVFLPCALSNVNTLMFSSFWGTLALGWSNWTAIVSCLLAASVYLCCFVMKIKLKAFWLLALKMTFHMTESKFMNLVCVCLLDEREECLEWAGWKTQCPGGKNTFKNKGILWNSFTITRCSCTCACNVGESYLYVRGWVSDVPHKHIF